MLCCDGRQNRKGSRLNTTRSEAELERVIQNACEKLVDDFTRLQSTVIAAHPEMERSFLAANLMEFGRGQISGIEEPSEDDSVFIMNHVDGLEMSDDDGYLFCSYVSGCVLGWVNTDQLPRGEMDAALAIVKECAEKQFPAGED